MGTAQLWMNSGKVFSEMHLILIYYGIALQQLTQDETINFDDEIKDCTSSLNSLLNKKGSTSLDSKFGSGFTSAIDETAKIVMKWASDTYRRSELEKVFADDGKDIRKFMMQLRSVSVYGYKKLLDREEEEASIYFDDMLKKQKDVVASTLLKERQMQFASELKERRAILASYSQKMDNIIAAHEALMELAWRGNLDVETLVTEVRLLVTDIYTIRDSFEVVE
ncbi:hypothetical protein [Pseudodesulfovibrio sediminis]|uniref:Uncharacterized protein n=1 Tax=Pseudodesulfovibrio sediminis TaxID=2810563 RepID=A0ABM7P554_9BACT|nr:hypothetical protein [Pseudodesulfovibrio sediminis]BCS87990.1 hypothetical protein PSDVSF_12320 [Pseudodesulfovibrio sediminis]